MPFITINKILKWAKKNMSQQNNKKNQDNAKVHLER